MTRPALSALRAIEIIDFMSQTPGQSYTLTELVHHTGTNVSSLHSILTVLLNRGYLLRHPVHKAYRLSPALAAIGEAVVASDPILGHAKRAATLLAARTGLEATLYARTGEDIICLGRSANSPLLRASTRVGRRVPLRPPLGTVYYAWSSEEEINEWISMGDPKDKEQRLEALNIVRERGYLVTLNSPSQIELKKLFSDAENYRPSTSKGTSKAFRNLEKSQYQIEFIDDNSKYDVDFIAAPIFNNSRDVTFSISIQGFHQPISGREIIDLSSELVTHCKEVMESQGIYPDIS